jgi:hypothetical protein
MSELTPYRRYEPGSGAARGSQPSSLADVLDRVLDKGLVIAGDISISLAQVELITIKIRLLLASADKAKEMGIDWWTRDPALSGGGGGGDAEDMDKDELVEQNRALREEMAALQDRLHALLHQPESTAASPTPLDASDLLAEKAGSGARGTAGGISSRDDGGDAQDAEPAAEERSEGGDDGDARDAEPAAEERSENGDGDDGDDEERDEG